MWKFELFNWRISWGICNFPKKSPTLQIRSRTLYARTWSPQPISPTTIPPQAPMFSHVNENAGNNGRSSPWLYCQFTSRPYRASSPGLSAPASFSSQWQPWFDQPISLIWAPIPSTTCGPYLLMPRMLLSRFLPLLTSQILHHIWHMLEIRRLFCRYQNALTYRRGRKGLKLKTCYFNIFHVGSLLLTIYAFFCTPCIINNSQILNKHILHI